MSDTHEHEPTRIVAHVTDVDDNPEIERCRAICSCGWCGTERVFFQSALKDALAHVADVVRTTNAS